MTAAVGGFGASCAWSVATLCVARAGRLASAISLLAGVSLFGLPIAATILLLRAPATPRTHDLVWLGVGGFGNIVGLLLTFAALRRGQIGLVASLVSMEGGVAALIAVLAGRSFDAKFAPALALMIAGVALAARTPRDSEARPAPDAGRAILLAVMAAGIFGISLYALARVSGRLDIAWAVLPPSLAGVVLVTLPLFAIGRFTLPRASLPLAAVAGVSEVLGFGSFAFGARSVIGIAAVFASQTGTLSAAAAACLFGERLTRGQLLGVSLVICGVTVLAIAEAVA